MKFTTIEYETANHSYIQNLELEQDEILSETWTVSGSNIEIVGAVYISQEMASKINLSKKMSLDEKKRLFENLKNENYNGDKGQVFFLTKKGHRGLSSIVNHVESSDSSSDETDVMKWLKEDSNVE